MPRGTYLAGVETLSCLRANRAVRLYPDFKSCPEARIPRRIGRLTSGRGEQDDAGGGGGHLQLAVQAGQRQGPENGQLQIGGVIGGKLVSSGQVGDVGK